MKEETFYPLIEEFLKEKKDCFKTGTKKGPRAMGSVDVIGVRDIGGQYSPFIEVIIVEVKKELWNFGTIIGQALGYSIYGHKCYLAVVFKEGQRGFSEEQKEIASNFGVGLIEIRPSRKENKCEEVQSSKLFSPMEIYMMSLLEKIGVYKCYSCGQYLEKCCFPKGGFTYLDMEPRKVFGMSGKYPHWKHQALCEDCQSRNIEITPADLMLSLANKPVLVQAAAKMIRGIRKNDVEISSATDYITFKVSGKPFFYLRFGWGECFYIQIPLKIKIKDPKGLFTKTKYDVWEVKIDKNNINQISDFEDVIDNAKVQISRQN